MKISVIQKIIDCIRRKHLKIEDSNKIIIKCSKKDVKISTYKPCFKIQGHQNTIIFDCTNVSNVNIKKLLKNLQKHLNIHISGNNNYIYFEFPITIKDISISMLQDNNRFSIKSTPNIFANACFHINHSSIVEIGKDSEIGNGNLWVVANNCYKQPHKLIIGDNVHIARDCIIRTSDGQAILDFETNQAINEPQDIIIGNHCWIMTRCMLVKGTRLPSNTAVAPYSFVNKKFDKEYTLLGGIPAKEIKQKFKWSTVSYVEHCRKYSPKENSNDK